MKDILILSVFARRLTEAFRRTRLRDVHPEDVEDQDAGS